jgi:hypothetical protein
MIGLRRLFMSVAPLIAGDTCRDDIAAPIGAALRASDQMLCRESKALRLFAGVPRAVHEFVERFDRRVPTLQSAIEAGLGLFLRGRPPISLKSRHRSLPLVAGLPVRTSRSEHCSRNG